MRSDVGGGSGILVGRTSSVPKLPVYVEPEDFLRHCLIVGSTGSGKTRFAARLSRELKHFGAVVVLDWYGEYVDAADRVIHVGVSDPVAIPIEDPLDAVFLLEEVLDLSSPQSYLLAKVLKKSKDLEHVVDLVEAYEPEARWEVETRASLARKLSLLLKYGRVFKVVPPGDIGKVDVLRGNGLAVFNLSNLKTLELKRLVALGTLNAVKYVKERGILEDSVFVVVEEAHNVMARSKLLQRYLAEVRKLGIGLIVITQSPASLDYEVMNNTNIKIVKTLKSAEDIAAISKSMNLSAGTAPALSRLELNEALVEAPSLSEPIVVELD